MCRFLNLTVLGRLVDTTDITIGHIDHFRIDDLATLCSTASTLSLHALAHTVEEKEEGPNKGSPEAVFHDLFRRVFHHRSFQRDENEQLA
jgi:hypothetical protein